MDRGGEKAESKPADDAKKTTQQNFKPNILGARRSKSPIIDEKIVVSKAQNAPCNRNKKTSESSDRNVKYVARSTFSSDLFV